MKNTNHDEIALLQLHIDAISAFNYFNIEKLLSLHSDDIILMEPGLPTVNGKQRVARFLEKIKEQQLRFYLEYIIQETEIIEDRAFVRGQVIKTTIKPNGTASDEMGRFISLCKKQYNGKWLRTHVMANSYTTHFVNSIAFAQPKSFVNSRLIAQDARKQFCGN